MHWIRWQFKNRFEGMLTDSIASMSSQEICHKTYNMNDQNGDFKLRRRCQQIKTWHVCRIQDLSKISSELYFSKFWSSVTVNEMNDKSLVPPFLCVPLNYRAISHQGLYRHARLIALPPEENCTQANLSITKVEPLKLWIKLFLKFQHLEHSSLEEETPSVVLCFSECQGNRGGIWWEI